MAHACWLQASKDHSAIPGIVNTQLVNPWAANDAAAKANFPGISVNDEDRANVRPPNPSLCVGDNYVMEVSDMVRAESLLPAQQDWGMSPCHWCPARHHRLAAWSLPGYRGSALRSIVGGRAIGGDEMPGAGMRACVPRSRVCGCLVGPVS